MTEQEEKGEGKGEFLCPDENRKKKLKISS